MWCISVKVMIISVRQKKCFLFLTLSKNEKIFAWCEKRFSHIINNFYFAEILSEPNSLTVVTSKKLLKMCNYVLILSIFFLIMRIRNLQCNKCCDCYLWRITQLVKVLQSSLKVPDANTTWLSAECRKPIVARLSLTSVSKLESEGIEWHSLVRLVSRHWPKFGRRTAKKQIKNKLKHCSY